MTDYYEEKRKGDIQMNTETLDQIKNEYYGEVGMPERDQLERELEALRIGFKIRSARKKLDMTQAELANRIDKKRTFISKVENFGMNTQSQIEAFMSEKSISGQLSKLGTVYELIKKQRPIRVR